MSFKAKIAAGAATFALAGGGLGMVGAVSASAATPSCGGCTNLSTLKFGPGFILDTFQGKATANQEVILFQASNSDPAEDFVKHSLGLVSDNRGLLSRQFRNSYGDDDAYEFQYTPYGVNSHFCASTWPGQTAGPGFKVRLEPCGHYANSIWAEDDAGGVPHVTEGYDVYINGATDSVSDPLVLNYPEGHPTDMPRPWLNVQPLNNYSTGVVFDSQQWLSGRSSS